MKYKPTHIVVCGFAFLVGHASAWTPGTYSSPMASKGFAVDAQNRNDVVAFWHAIYQASEGYEDRVGWTGDYALNAGTISEPFIRDVERRLNFFRALGGVPADAALNTSETVNIFTTGANPDPVLNRPPASTLKSQASQEAAYMVVRAHMAGNTLNHNPPSTTPAWTPAAWNGIARGNFTYGYFGPGAIDAYMRDYEAGSDAASSSWNAAVGHRRWNLYSRATDFATGDTPGQFIPPSTIRPPTNVLYAIPKASELATVAPRFISYPTAGFFPASFNTPFWSLSYPGANFTNATVVMKDHNDVEVSVTKVNQSNTAAGRGDPSLVWQVNDAAATSTAADMDRNYTVSVSGITGTDVPGSFSYTVTLINPGRLTSDQTLIGSAAPPAGASANYFLTRPPGAEAVEVNVFHNSPTGWTENAEAVSPTIIDHTYGNYTFRSGVIGGFGPVSGTKSFRLTHPVRYDVKTFGVPEQIFEINREILPIPAVTSTLNFKYKKGYMLAASSLVVEYTRDDGATWNQLGSPIQGVGASSMTPDASALNWSAAFPQSTDPYRVRFRFYKSGTGSTYNHQDPSTANEATGIFLDDITTTNCTWLELKKTNQLDPAADRFVLSASTATEAGTPITNGTQFHLRMRTKLGNHWFAYGPSKVVTADSTPIEAFDGWLAYEYPTLTGGFTGDHDGDGVSNGIEYAFALDPLSPSPSRDSIGFTTSPVKDPPGPYISISRPANGIRDELTAEWSETLAPGSWSSEGVTVTYSEADQMATATAPLGSGKRFLRWKVSIP